MNLRRPASNCRRPIPRLRGWEWHYLARLADSSVAATSAFSLQVREVRFSRNGDAVLARGYDAFVGAGRGVQGAAPARASELSVTRVPVSAVSSLSRLKLGERVVAISPDGTRVLTANWNVTDYPPVCLRRDDEPSGATVCQPGPGYRPARNAPSPEERDRLVVRDTTTGDVVATLIHPNLGVWTTTRPSTGRLVAGTRVNPYFSSVTVSGSRVPLAMLERTVPRCGWRRIQCGWIASRDLVVGQHHLRLGSRLAVDLSALSVDIGTASGRCASTRPRTDSCPRRSTERFVSGPCRVEPNCRNCRCLVPAPSPALRIVRMSPSAPTPA